MQRALIRSGLGLFTGLLLVFVLALPAHAADENADLRQQALALNNFTGDDAIDGEIKLLTREAAGAKKLLAAATPVLKEKPQPLNYNAAYILAHVALEQNDLEAGRLFFRLCIEQSRKLKSGQRVAMAYRGLLELLSKNKKYDESVQVCKEILEMDDEEGQMHRLKSAVLQLVIEAMAQQGKTEEALKLADNLVKARPDDWRTLEIRALVLRESGRNEEAAKAYEDVLDRIGKDESLKKEEKAVLREGCRYILSGVYVDLNQIDKAAAELKALLAKKPDNPTYNNDLGYIWADHDMNLAEAESMIRRAIDEERKQRKKVGIVKPEEDKDNAAYLDSLGWVLYKEKKFEEAKKYLEEAVQDKEEGQHLEIYDHLGEVCMALGNKADAIAAWQKAIQSAGKSKREQARKEKVEKKIKEHP